MATITQIEYLKGRIEYHNSFITRIERLIDCVTVNEEYHYAKKEAYQEILDYLTKEVKVNEPTKSD